jgi:hypothetical protein
VTDKLQTKEITSVRIDNIILIVHQILVAISFFWSAYVFNRISKYSSEKQFKFGLSMYILSHILLTVFCVINAVFRCMPDATQTHMPIITEPDANNYYYLWCSQRCCNEQTPDGKKCSLLKKSFRLHQNENIADNIYMIITYFFPATVLLIANLYAVGSYYNNPDKLILLMTYGYIILCGQLIPMLLYFVMYPCIYMMSILLYKNIGKCLNHLRDSYFMNKTNQIEVKDAFHV